MPVPLGQKELGSNQIKAAQCTSVLIAFALYKDVAWEFQQRDEKARLLNTRLEHLLLRESERIAARLAERESHQSTPEEPPTASPGKEDNSKTRPRA